MKRLNSFLIILFFILFFPQSVFAADVIINEYFPNPPGSSEGSEWIELYNTTDSEIDLAGWKIDDKLDEGSSLFVIPQNSLIPAKGFFILERSVTGIILNNDTDKIRLLDDSDEITDEYEYVETEENVTYGRKTDGGSEWVEFFTSTKNSSNETGMIVPTPTVTIQPTDEPTKTPTAIKASTPNKIPTNSLIPTEKPSPTMIKKSPTLNKTSPSIKKEQIVLGEKIEQNTPSLTPLPTQDIKIKGSSGFSPDTISFSLGGVFLLACGILTFYIKKKALPID